MSHRVLVVEDERIIALTIRQMLEERGYTVVGTASSADAAVEKAERVAPDIVLMDIHLEGRGDGIDAAHRIQAASGTPIVFLTAFTEDETIRRASECKAYSYLVKPIQSAELHATLQIAISKHLSDLQLRSSELRLRLALQSASIAVWEWNSSSGRVETVGDVAGLLGQKEPPAETLSGLFSRVIPEDKAQFRQFVERASTSNAPENLTFRYQWSDQGVRWIQSHAAAHQAPTGPRTIGTLRDITAQQETESRLRQAAALFENIADAIVITDPELRITATNPAFERITGYSTARANLLPIHTLFAFAHGTAIRWQGETQCQRVNGETFSVWLTVAPVSQDGTVSAVIYSFSDIGPLRRAEADLEFLAHHDPLTGLPNRLHFNESLDNLIAQSRPFALFYIDLDHFKLVNDSRSHHIGDLVLKSIASRISGLLSGGSFAARHGGDEFIVVYPLLTGEAESLSFGAALLELIAVPQLVGMESLIITASIGISEFPGDAQEREHLVRAADTAMYAAKRDGHNCCRRYSPSIHIPHSERYEIEQDIRRAFETSQLRVLYQPTLSLLTGRITGVEALVRWRHPERGILNPDRFIPIAEEAGLIEQLGAAVLRMACQDWMHWQRAGLPTPRLGINVSSRQITRGGFPGMLAGVLRDFPVPPESLEIEITESSLQTLERSQAFIKYLKGMNVAVSVDDFGTGYSSLATLRDLPVDRMKMDRSFLPAGEPRVQDVELLKALVSIARALGLQLTAEGVETESQFALVRQLGFDEAQGFWLSHPLPFEAIVELIERQPFVFPLQRPN